MARKESKPSNSAVSEPNASESAIESFETEFERLTGIVDRLEAGNVPLAEMISLYEQGMQLATGLKEVLSRAELRVEKLAAMHEESARLERALPDAVSSLPASQEEDEGLLF